MKKISKKGKETFILVMPTYNEELNIQKAIHDWSEIIFRFPGSEILVINDGSTDNTKKILNKLIQKYKFLKVVHKQNEGHGKTILLGYKMAVTSNYDWVFQTDSDGHFDPKDFYKLWKKRDKSNFILGFRNRRRDHKHRLFISRLASIWILVLFGKNIKDANIPFRLIKRIYLKDLLTRVPEGVFAPNIFLSILAAKDGHNLYHIPVVHNPRIKQGNGIKIFKGAVQTFTELLLFSLKII